MIWKLFLDDERYPPDDDGFSYLWRIARNVDDAMYYIRTCGMPDFMSLDHDLGYGKMTGMDFVKTLTWWCDRRGISPTAVNYYVHSMNPVGAENMRSYLESWKLHAAA